MPTIITQPASCQEIWQSCEYSYECCGNMWCMDGICDYIEKPSTPDWWDTTVKKRRTSPAPAYKATTKAYYVSREEYSDEEEENERYEEWSKLHPGKKSD